MGVGVVFAVRFGGIQGMEERRVETLQQPASGLGDENVEVIVEDRKRSGEHCTLQLQDQCVH